jgi:hypothetical protein
VIHALLDDASEGIGARKTLGARRSEDATRRASQAVVHAARCCGQGGKRRRLKDGEAVQVFPRPSEHVMLFARRAASLLYYREIQKTAAAAKAIHISSDDKTFGDFHAKGTVLAFITVRDNPETADAFGECECVSANPRPCTCPSYRTQARWCRTCCGGGTGISTNQRVLCSSDDSWSWVIVPA